VLIASKPDKNSREKRVTTAAAEKRFPGAERGAKNVSPIVSEQTNNKNDWRGQVNKKAALDYYFLKRSYFCALFRGLQLHKSLADDHHNGAAERRKERDCNQRYGHWNHWRWKTTAETRFQVPKTYETISHTARFDLPSKLRVPGVSYPDIRSREEIVLQIKKFV
jgi:hypothetical protein